MLGTERLRIFNEAQWEQEQDQDQEEDEECKAARGIESYIGLPSHSPRRNGRPTFRGCQAVVTSSATGVGGSPNSGFLDFSLPYARSVPVKSWSRTS